MLKLKHLDFRQISKTLHAEELQTEISAERLKDSLPKISKFDGNNKKIKEIPAEMLYKQDSLRQLIKNDSRRYFPQKELDKDLIPRMMKHDKYFGSIRKYILEKYNTEGKVRKVEKNPNELLKKLT